MSRSVSVFGRRLQAGGLVIFVAALVLSLAVHTPRALAAPSATATPNSGLHDQDTTHVTGSGFPPLATIHIVECVRGATSSLDCEGFTDDPTIQSDQNGNYDNPAYIVYVLPDNADSTASIQCDGTGQHECDLLITTDFNDFTQPHAFVPIEFASGGATTTTTTHPPSTTTTTVPSGVTTTTQPTTSTTTITGSGSTSTTATTAAGNSASTTTTATVTAAGTSSGGSGSSGGASGSPSGGSTDPAVAAANSGSLPLTSAPPLAPWLAGLGLITFGSGTVVRRNALRDPLAQ